jgi:hypothetical protein
MGVKVDKVVKTAVDRMVLLLSRTPLQQVEVTEARVFLRKDIQAILMGWHTVPSNKF